MRVQWNELLLVPTSSARNARKGRYDGHAAGEGLDLRQGGGAAVNACSHAERGNKARFGFRNGFPIYCCPGLFALNTFLRLLVAIGGRGASTAASRAGSATTTTALSRFGL